MRFIKNLLCVIMVILFMCGCSINAPPQDDTRISKYSDKVIAHAMGSIEGLASTNSLEAFENSYNCNFRYFEVDFFNTADHRIVAIHDWEQWFEWIGIDINDQPYKAYSYYDFITEKIAGKYTPLDIERIAEIMVKYPDVHIITDTKRPADKLYSDDISRIYVSLEMFEKDLSERLIVQAYTENNIKTAQKLVPDSNIIFTAYMSGMNSSEIADICRRYPDLFAVTVFKDKITDEILSAAKDSGVKVYIHTVNTDEDYQSYFDKGVYGLYTDDILPALIDDIHK